HLAHKLERLAVVFLDRQPGRFPGVDTALEDIGLAGAAIGEPRRVARGAHARAAQEHHRGVVLERTEFVDWTVDRTGDTRPREFVTAANVDQPRAGLGEPLGLGGSESGES